MYLIKTIQFQNKIKYDLLKDLAMGSSDNSSVLSSLHVVYGKVLTP